MQLLFNNQLVGHRLGGIQHDEDHIAGQRGSQHLATAAFAILGAFDDTCGEGVSGMVKVVRGAARAQAAFIGQPDAFSWLLPWASHPQYCRQLPTAAPTMRT